MKCSVVLALLATAVLALQHVPQAAAQKKVVCYFSYWAAWRNGDGKFDVEDIDPHLCTHALFAFAGVNWDGTVKVLDPDHNLGPNGAYKRFNNLRNQNSNLKTMIAIGGFNEGSAVFSEVCKSGLRGTFVQSLYNFVKEHGFNGLDLDWEYPARNGGAPYDKENFVLLIKELKAKFAPEGLLLSAAVSANVHEASRSYDIPQVASNVDFVNIMAYDLHGFWDPHTGINAPLFPSYIDTDLSLNAEAAVRHWLTNGADARKIVLGIPTYGRTFTLKNANSPGLGAEAKGPGDPGPFTLEAGFLGYNELCELEKTGGYSVNWADQQMVPFAFRGDQWVGFDDERSVSLKTNFAKLSDLGGVMAWSLETDDFRNICGKGKFPLINAMKTVINEQ